jgi:hypothetical protein
MGTPREQRPVAFFLRRRLNDPFCRPGLLGPVASQVLKLPRPVSVLAWQPTEQATRSGPWADAVRREDARLERESALDGPGAHRVS